MSLQENFPSDSRSDSSKLPSAHEGLEVFRAALEMDEFVDRLIE